LRERQRATSGIAIVSVLASSLLVLAAPPAGAFDDAALARQAYERHILPGYASFASAAQNFAARAATLCKAPSADALAKARDAARSAALAWGRMENIRFGPITAKQRLERLLFYPDPHGIARRQIDRLLASHDSSDVTPEKLAGASVAVQGFSAVDRVLYGKGSEELAAAAPAGPFRCLYLQALAADIAEIAEDTHAEWGDYKSTWLSPGGANKTYLSAKETTLALFRSYVTELEVIRLQRLEPLLGRDEKTSGRAGSLLAGSGLALPFILANIEGERALLTLSGFVDPALARGDKEQSAMAILGSIVTDLGFAIRAGEAAAAMSPDPFADADARDRLAPMLLSLKNAEETGRAALGDLTGQSLGFNSLDGD
jgi:predicted lipoprotein